MAKLKLLGGQTEDLPYTVISLEPETCPHNVAVWRHCQDCATDYMILAFVRARPGVDIGQISQATGIPQGPANNPMSSRLNQCLARLRDAGELRTNNQWGAPRFFAGKEE